MQVARQVKMQHNVASLGTLSWLRYLHRILCMSMIFHWRRKRGGGKGGMCPPPPLFRVGSKDMFVPPPHFQTQNLGMCPPPHILSRSYAVVFSCGCLRILKSERFTVRQRT